MPILRHFAQQVLVLFFGLALLLAAFAQIENVYGHWPSIPKFMVFFTFGLFSDRIASRVFGEDR